MPDGQMMAKFGENAVFVTEVQSRFTRDLCKLKPPPRRFFNRTKKAMEMCLKLWKQENKAQAVSATRQLTACGAVYIKQTTIKRT